MTSIIPHLTEDVHDNIHTLKLLSLEQEIARVRELIRQEQEKKMK